MYRQDCRLLRSGMTMKLDADKPQLHGLLDLRQASPLHSTPGRHDFNHRGPSTSAMWQQPAICKLQMPSRTSDGFLRIPQLVVMPAVVRGRPPAGAGWVQQQFLHLSHQVQQRACAMRGGAAVLRLQLPVTARHGRPAQARAALNGQGLMPGCRWPAV